MKKLFTLLLVLLLVCGCSNNKKEGDVKVGILQLGSFEALNSVTEGFKDYFKENGIELIDKQNLDYQNPELDAATLATMADSLVNANCDVILSIATSPTQVLKTVNIDTPIVGCAVTDYVDAGIVDSNENPGGLITGVSDNCDMNAQLDLLKKILPNVKKIGILYSSAEVNSQIQADQFADVCKKNNIEVVEKTSADKNDIEDCMNYLVRQGVEAVYIPTDNAISSAMASVHKVAVESKIVLLNAESGQVETGGLISLGCDYYKLGKQAGEMAMKIINGADPATMPIEFQKEFSIYYNSDTANKLGITLPADVIENGIDLASK